MSTIRVWTVLGAGGVGKSTTIGHLAGDFGAGANGLQRGRAEMFKDVLLRGGGYLGVYRRRQSLQEARISPEGAEKKIRRQSVRVEGRGPKIRGAYFNVLLALRTDRTGNLPTADVYLSHFVSKGWQLKSFVLLSPKAAEESLYARFGVPTCTIYESDEVEISHLVGQARNHFGWA